MASWNWTWDDALRGVIPPMISPLTEAHLVDDAAVGRVVDYILAGDADMPAIEAILRQHDLLPPASVPPAASRLRSIDGHRA